MAGCLDNVQLPNIEGCVEVGDKRNKVASIAAGILFFAGWWFAIDVAAVYPQKAELKDVFQICGVFGTISFFMVNAVSNGQLRGESYTTGCLGVTSARIWFFFGFLLGFGSLIGACWILFGEYVTNDCYEIGTKYSAVRPLNSTIIDVVQNCQAACNENPKCQYFSWLKTTDNCSLLEDKGGVSQEADYISGPKACADGRTFVPTLTYPGVGIFMQNLLIFVSSLVYKFGRSEELWG